MCQLEKKHLKHFFPSYHQKVNKFGYFTVRINVSEMLSETPFALLLMALYEQIHMCTGRGKLYECAFVFEKMYEQSQIKLIFYKSEFHAFSEAFS